MNCRFQIIIFAMVLSLVVSVSVVFCGELESPAAPDDPASAMPTLEDLFLRLTEGADFTLRTSFAEPSSGPGATGFTLVELMIAAPVADDIDGASTDEVVSGKTFWGLRRDGSGWGMLTGTMDAQNIDPSTTAQVGGVYGSFDLAHEDPDLHAGNITSGVTVFGIEGAAIQAAGTALPDEVLAGRTFSNADGGAVGSMADNGAVVLVPEAASQVISAGFHNGSGIVQGDEDLEAANIKAGVEVFGVTGSLNAGCICEGTLYGERWCDNLDGTVTDLTTCLLWLRRTDWGQVHPWAEGESTTGAHSRASSLKAGDLGAYLVDGSVAGDWRLPTKQEAVGLVSGAEAVSVTSPRAFVGITATNYWTSAGSDVHSNLAWTIGPDNGLPALAPKVSAYSVWPVRSAQ